MVGIAGITDEDRKLWNTYLFWARGAVDPGTPSNRALDIAKQRRRVRATDARALQAILFTVFALEYRLKRIYEVLGLKPRKRDTLGTLINNFRHRVESARRLDRSGLVRLPPEWSRVHQRLSKLNDLRNAIAHGNYAKVIAEVSSRPRAMPRLARTSYNVLVDVIRITNNAIGYDLRTKREIVKYYRRLKVLK
jgi:hypothetical protein